jgi:WD40 repeat protein
MEDALRASIAGLDRVDQARKRKGWNRQSVAWAQVALTSVASLKQFWRRERINRETFRRICAAVEIADWQAIAEIDVGLSEPVGQQVVDWGEAPEIGFFCGREAELERLIAWIVGAAPASSSPQPRAKLVTLLGMGGMGKTTLAVRLAEQIASQFEAVVWRSLRNAPPLENLLADLLQVLATEAPTDPTATQSQQLSRLLSCLRDRRCLIVLDNAESILAGGMTSIGGHYRAGHEAYGELLRRIGEERHQSCLLVTSREQPKDVALLEGNLEGDRVRSLQLRGLLPADGQKLLERMGSLAASDLECGAIVDHYAGNPLALKIVAVGIRDLLSNRVQDFLTLLEAGSFAFSDIQDLLERHFIRLSHAEQEVLIWLAIAREPIALEELKLDLLSPESRWKVTETLESLKRRSLLELTPVGFTLQPAVMEYVTEHLISSVCGEIVAAIGTPETSSVVTLRNHALVKATAKDYIRAAQTRLILEPILDRLQAIFDTTDKVKSCLSQLLPRFQRKPAIKTGYIAGNLLNLLGHLRVDLSGYDFSHLTIWQADLRRVALNGVNFSHADLGRSVFTETFSTVLSVAFSPDGRSLAKCDDRGGVSIRQIETGHQVQAFRAHHNWIFAVAYSPDGTLIATGGLDRTVKLWNVATGDCVQSLQFHAGSVSALAFSPAAESGLLASGSADHTIKLLDWRTGTCQQTLSGHVGIVRAIAFSPDGQWLASVSLDQTLKLWDIRTGTCQCTIAESVPIYGVAFVPTPVEQPPLQVVTAGDDGVIKHWVLSSGECLQVLEGHSDRVWSLAVDASGRWLVSAGDDRSVKLWDLDMGHCVRTLPGHQKRIWSVAISPDGTTIASGSDDRTVRLWSLPEGQCLRTLQGYHNRTSPIAILPSIAPTTAESPATRQIVTFSTDQVVRFWAYPMGNCQRVLPLPTHGAMQATLSPVGASGLIASGSLDHRIYLCSVNNGMVRSLHGHITWVRSVSFSLDGTRLASASGDQTAKLWNVITGDCLHTLVGHTNPVQSVAFHPAGHWLASGSWDQTVKLWDTATGNCVQTLIGHTAQVREIAFTIDGEQLISSSQDHTIRIWDWRSGECFRVLATHTADVEAIAVSPDGKHLASASLDGTLRLWQLDTGDCLRVLSQTIDGCGGLVFSPDGQLLASGSEDGTTTLWDVNMGKVLAVLQVPRPYEGMNITAVTGLTTAQAAALLSLGAVQEGNASRT